MHVDVDVGVGVEVEVEVDVLRVAVALLGSPPTADCLLVTNNRPCK